MAEMKAPPADAMKLKTADIIFGIIVLVALAALAFYMK